MRTSPPASQEYHLRDDQSLISRTDTRGIITYANQDFIEACGYSEAELIGSPHNIVRNPDMPKEAFEDMWRELKAGNSWTGLVKNRRKNGDYYWVLANATPITENGVCIGYTSVRTRPSRDQVEAASAAYAKFRDGTARGLRIRKGRVEHAGAIGRVVRLLRLNLRTRMVYAVALPALLALGSGAYGMAALRAAGDMNAVQDRKSVV